MREKRLLTGSVIGFLIALLMILFIRPFLWVEAADIGVDITVEAANVDITVPSTLPIIFNADGSNTFPENFSITNNSKTTGIFLTKAEMNANGSGWKLLAASENTKTLPVDTKSIKFSVGKEGLLRLVKPVNGSVSEKGSCTFGSTDIVIEAEQSQILSFAVERGIFTGNSANGKAFELVLTFDWVKNPVLTTGKEFYSTIPIGTEQIIFTDEIAPEGISLTDVSEVKNKSVVSWSDERTYYVSSQEKGSKVIANKDCEGMFGNETESNTWCVGCIDVACLDTSNVYNMNFMFCCAGKDAINFEIKGLSEWNTSKVNRMIGMFSEAGYNSMSFDIGKLDNWDVSYVSLMTSMFKNAGYCADTFQIGDLSSWKTSNVKYMDSMFEGAGYRAISFDIGDLSNWDVSYVGYMNSMFKNAGAGSSVKVFHIGNLENWDTRSVNNMSNMFENAGRSASWSLDCSKWHKGRECVDFNKGVERKVIMPGG